MTTKDSILALAAKISNDTVPNVATDAQALGELAKAMCGTAPEVPLATVDDAIAFITANYSGGGGGVTLGNLCAMNVHNEEQGGIECNYWASIDGAAKVGVTATEMTAAAGFVMDIMFPADASPTITALVIKPDQTEEAFTDFTVSPDSTFDGYYHITFTVPDLPVDDTDPDNPPVYSMLMFTF